MERQLEFEIVLRMSQKGFPVKKITDIMHVNRRGYYYWLNHIVSPSEKQIEREANKKTFSYYHNLHPSYGYRRLNSLVKHEEGLMYSNVYVQKLCQSLGISSQSEKIKPKAHYSREMTYTNLLSKTLNVSSPYQVVVSDMTMLKYKGNILELTMFVDIFNNEILTYAIGLKRGDRTSYIAAEQALIEIKKRIPDLVMILHTDQGTVYSSKAFNDQLKDYNIMRSMSRAGHPTDNARMEALIGWIKDELYGDFNFNSCENPIKLIKEYVDFFNNKRPSSKLNYMTPREYKELYYVNHPDEVRPG